ncbi:MAG: endonuclease/exonuclease/phosphatase family protein [Thermoleophilaceae bacterium]
MRALSWNLFHGRDFPPESPLRSLRSRLKANRPLREEFGGLIASWDWDIALLQEVPPRWLRPLAAACRAHGASALTSRNQLALLRALLADWSPNLIASNEGGSNQLLVRPPGRLVEVRRLTLTRLPERRRMLWARVALPGGPLAVANLHATAGDPSRAAEEVIVAANRAVEWAAGDPLVFGGDLNLRPRSEAELFARLREHHGLGEATAPDAIDHLLVRGLAVVEPPRRLPSAAREVAVQGRRLRLSDHAPVRASFALHGDTEA